MHGVLLFCVAIQLLFCKPKTFGKSLKNALYALCQKWVIKNYQVSFIPIICPKPRSRMTFEIFVKPAFFIQELTSFSE